METTPEAEPYDVMRADCPARQILDGIADKWTVLVVLALAAGPLRFARLRSKVEGVSQKMLTQTLRGLERDGMVDRTAYPTVPVTVEYALTPLGRSLVDAVVGLRRWSHAHIDKIDQARRKYDARKSENAG
jgi:DNA-binding HxlR family transcriptional regulator